MKLPPVYSSSTYGEPRVRMRDLSIQDKSIKQKYVAVLDRFLDHGIFIKGHEVSQVEQRLHLITAKKYNVLVSCASSGLFLSLKSVGIGPGDEVITTPLSWLMTSSVITQVGAHPVFCDVNDDFNINLELVPSLITPKTKAIMPVHYYGKVLDTYNLRNLCEEKNLFLIEDVAQAAGGSINGSLAGHNAHISVISFGPMKNIAALGDLGLVATDDAAIAEKIRQLSECGVINGEVCIEPSLKHYPDALQAAFLDLALSNRQILLQQRIAFADLYTEYLSSCEDLILPMRQADSYFSHTFFDYTIRVKSNRDHLLLHLFRNQIEAKVRHPVSICQQRSINLYNSPPCLNAIGLVNSALCLPMHYNLTSGDIKYVCDSILSFFS